MLFAQKGGLAAAENTNENQCGSSRLDKLWHSLRATSKEPYQRKVAEAATVHRRKYPDYVHNAREAHRRKQQEHRAKEIAGKLENDSYGDQEQQPSTSTAAALGRGTTVFQQHHHPPSTQRNICRATNQRVSSRLGKPWRFLSATNKEPYQRKVAEAAAVHQRKYADYVYNVREAHRRKQHEHRAKEVAGKLENDRSGDQEQQPSASTAVAQGRGTMVFQQQHHPPSTQSNMCRATKQRVSSRLGKLWRSLSATSKAPYTSARLRTPVSERRWLG